MVLRMTLAAGLAGRSSLEVTGPTTPGPGATRPGPPPARARPRREWGPVFVAIGIAVAVVGVYFAGHIGAGSSPGVGTAVSYSQASQGANAAAAGIAGGPWELVAAAGVDLSAGAYAQPNASLGTGCTYTSPGGGIPPLSEFVPAFASQLASGDSPWWGLVYYQASSHSVLLIAVRNGTVNPLVVATGSCTSNFANLSQISSNVVDSSIAAATSWSNGGSTYAAAHAGSAVNLEMGLVNDSLACSGAVSGCWLLRYTPCDPLTGGGPTGSQATFVVLVDARTGSILTTVSLSTTCSATGITETGAIAPTPARTAEHP